MSKQEAVVCDAKNPHLELMCVFTENKHKLLVERHKEN